MSDLVQRLQEPWAEPATSADAEVQRLYKLCQLAASEIKCMHAAYCHSQQQFLDATQEIERLRKDAERLDLIEKRARCDPKMDGQHVWWPTSFNHRLVGPTLRAAIDSAMQSAKE